MKLIPAKGYVFIIEEKSREVTESGLYMGSKNMEVIGTIFAVANETGGIFYELWRFLFGKNTRSHFKKNDKIIFSRYLTEDTYVENEEGRKIENMRVIPIHAILAKIL